MQPKIFISHSAKTPEGAQVLDDVCAELMANDFDVLVDRIRLKEAVGDRWRDALNTWMELCQGAIAIIDQTALTSGWVKQELAILAWRANRDPAFRLLPIVVPPVTFAELRNADLYPSGIGAIQAISAEDDYLCTARARCEELRAGGGAPGSVEKLEILLSSRLSKIERGALVQAARECGEDLNRWSPGISKHQALARLLLGAGLPDAVPALTSLGLDAQDLKNIAGLLAIAWVDCRAVETVQRIAHGPIPERAIALNGDELALSHWYVQRASGAVPGWSRVVVRVGTNENDEEAVVSQVRDFLELTGPPGISAKRHLAALKAPNASLGGPIFLLFEAPEPDREILDRLRLEFPAFTFFLLTGDDIPPPASERTRSGAYFLRPELGADDVTRILAAYSITHQQLLANG